MPDFIAALRYRDSWGAVNVSGLGRHFNHDTGLASESASGWGFHAGATVNLPFIAEGDKIVGLFNIGQGLGRYLTGSSGSGSVMVHCNTAGLGGADDGNDNNGTDMPDPSGASPLTHPGCDPSMSVATSWGVMVGGTHQWTGNISSNVYYGHTEHDYTNDAGPLMLRGLVSALDSVHANLMWNPVSSVTVGLEFIHGWLDTVSQTTGVESSGTASRFQLGMKYGF